MDRLPLFETDDAPGFLDAPDSVPEPVPAEYDPEFFADDDAFSVAVASVPTRRSLSDITAALNAPQADATTTLSGPLLVIAGPGSGKTRVLTHRIAALLLAGAKPWEILAVTFTNKAAAEMRERVATLVGDEQAEAMWVATFHSACARLLRYHPEAAGLRRGFAIADSDDARKILRKLLAGTVDSQKLAKVVDQASTAISLAKNHIRSPEDLASSHDAYEQSIAELYGRYQSRLAEQNLVDFDDLLMRVVILLRENPDIRTRYQKRFRWMLVDEFQDTNACQYEIIRLMVGPEHNVMVVGDQNQSVYGFRGAAPEVVDRFARDYPEAKIVVLDENYRSTKSILEVCQAIIEPIQGPNAKTLWTNNDEGDRPLLVDCADDTAEAEYVVAQVSRANDPPEAHAVLYRTNAQSRIFEQELISRDVPYQMVGSLRFFDRAEVKDALSYLRVLANPTDETSLVRAASMPKRRLGDATLVTLAERGRLENLNPIEYARAHLGTGALGRADAPLTSFLADLATVSHAAQSSPAAALRTVLALPGFLAAACESTARVSLAEERKENLDELVTAAERFLTDPPPGARITDDDGNLRVGLDLCEAFLEHVSLMSSVDETTPHGVQLMTAHAAKGREFPHVYVVGIEDELFPHANATDVDAIAEERRLLFVAASRAMKSLTLSYARHRFLYGTSRSTVPSPFLSDVFGLVDVLELESQNSNAWRSTRRPSYQTRRPGQKASSISSSNHLAGAVRAHSQSTRVTATRIVNEPVDAPRLAASELHVGVKVDHTAFGTGTVTNLSVDTARILFADKERTLMLAHAPLRLA